jgi:hypothetical protein
MSVYLPVRESILSQVGTIPSTATDASHPAEPLVLPSPVLQQRKPRIDCPVCSRTVTSRLDGTPWAHRPLPNRPDLAVPGGNCRGGYR